MVVLFLFFFFFFGDFVFHVFSKFFEDTPAFLHGFFECYSRFVYELLLLFCFFPHPLFILSLIFCYFFCVVRGFGPSFFISATNSVTTVANFCPSEAETYSNRTRFGSIPSSSNNFFSNLTLRFVL